MEQLRSFFNAYLYPIAETFILRRITKDPPTELETYRYGNEKSGNILFFIHGFPDNHSLWNGQIEHFKNDYLCYTITLPNYNANNIDYNHKYGYDYHLVAKVIANKLIDISKAHNADVLHAKNITLVMHDFGTIYGYMAYQLLVNNNIEIIKNLVFIDVGDGLDSSTSTFQSILFVLYHWYLLIVFCLPNCIGKWCIFLLCYYPGSPLCTQWKIREISNYMNHSYFHLWRRRLHIGGRDVNCDELTIWNIPNDVNIFFGFGQNFSIKFHTQRWKHYLQTNENCFYKGYDAGHWVMVDQCDLFNRDLGKWLKI